MNEENKNNAEVMRIVRSIISNLDLRKLSCDGLYKDTFKLETNSELITRMFKRFKANFLEKLQCHTLPPNQFPNTPIAEECYMLKPIYDAIVWFEHMNYILEKEQDLQRDFGHIRLFLFQHTLEEEKSRKVGGMATKKSHVGSSKAAKKSKVGSGKATKEKLITL